MSSNRQPNWLDYTVEETEKIRQELEDEQTLRDIDAVYEQRGLGVIREVLLEVIDDGDVRLDGRRVPWALDHPFEGIANTARLDFCDAVCQRLQKRS